MSRGDGRIRLKNLGRISRKWHRRATEGFGWWLKRFEVKGVEEQTFQLPPTVWACGREHPLARPRTIVGACYRTARQEIKSILRLKTRALG